MTISFTTNLVQNISYIFVGISLILVGDLGQLPPIKDRVPYDIRRCVKILWQDFNIVITLEKVYRQEGENLDQNKFRQLLTNIRDAQPTIDDWKLLMSRTTCNIPKNVNDDFDNNVHLFSTNENVHKHHRKKLYSLRELVAPLIATKLSNYSSLDNNFVDELDIELLILKRSRVMLTSNVWIEAGLVKRARIGK